MSRDGCPKALTRGTFRVASHDSASPCSVRRTGKDEVRPEGFEPPTLGSEDRCAIQLRHGR